MQLPHEPHPRVESSQCNLLMELYTSHPPQLWLQLDLGVLGTPYMQNYSYGSPWSEWRHWTTDQRCQRGLEAKDHCFFCDQELESIDHIVVSCSFSQQVWWNVCVTLMGNLASTMDRNLQARGWFHLCIGCYGTLEKRGTQDAFTASTPKWCRICSLSSTVKLSYECKPAQRI